MASSSSGDSSSSSGILGRRSDESLTPRDRELGTVAPGGGGSRGASRLGARRRKFAGAPTWLCGGGGSSASDVVVASSSSSPAYDDGGGGMLTFTRGGSGGPRAVTESLSPRRDLGGSASSSSPETPLAFNDSGERIRRRVEFTGDDGTGTGRRLSGTHHHDMNHMLKKKKKKGIAEEEEEEEEDDKDDDNDGNGGGSPRGSNSSSSSSESSEVTLEQLRLLYMIKRYTDDTIKDPGGTTPPHAPGTRWVRIQPLLVLIYEGIIDEVFDYDYAPQAQIVMGKRIYVNVSQEGQDDIDDLCEFGFVQNLKLTSESYQSGVALRISEEGLSYLKANLDDASRDAVDALIFKEGDLVDVAYQTASQSFKIYTRSGWYARTSTITDIETVSYVSSPFVPASLRVANLELVDNSARCADLAQFAASNIKDRLEEKILIDDVYLLTCEWVPMGGNQIVALNDKLGSGERVQGGFFTAAIDAEPDSTQFTGKNEGMTAVRLLDYDEASYINFEAEVFFENDDGILQIENFGVHFDENGLVAYGLKIDAIMDRIKVNLSLDLMSRLLVDVMDDSSTVVSNLFAAHQRAMLDLTFLGDSDNRDKFNCIVADAVRPKMPAEKYMDKEDYENELKQVIGDTYSGHDLSDDEVIIIGKMGVFLAGSNSLRHQAFIVCHGSFHARSIFMKRVFNRCFILADILRRTRGLIEHHQNNPENMAIVRKTLSTCTEDVITLGEIQSFLAESMDGVDLPEPIEGDPASFALREVLRLDVQKNELRRRAIDMKKTIVGCANELEALRDMAHVIGMTNKGDINEGIEATTKNLEDAFRAQARNHASLEIMQVIFAGQLAFDIVDRAFGGYLGVASNIAYVADFVNPYLVSLPAVWFAINMCFWGVLGGGLIYFLRQEKYSLSAVDNKKITINGRVDMNELAKYLKTKKIEAVDVVEDEKTTVKKYTWTEAADAARFKGVPPRFDLHVDERYGFLLSAYVTIFKRRCKLRADDVYDLLLDELDAHEVWSEEGRWKGRTGQPSGGGDGDDDDDDEGEGGRSSGGKLAKKSSGGIERSSSYTTDLVATGLRPDFEMRA